MEIDEVPKSGTNTSDVPETSLPVGFSKRKLKKVRNQLEFYFSSTNLLKDTYLQQHMSPPMSQQQSELGRGYVELDLLTQFGVVRELTGGNVEAVRRGAELSPHLELSEDGRCVRRKEPVTPLSEEEVTLRTIYVEHFPPKLNSQQALQKLFSKYGAVTYVSLPHYRTKNCKSKQAPISKGFAFIEFSSPHSVARAVSALRANQNVLTERDSDVSELELAPLNNSLALKHSPPVKFGKDLTNKSNKTAQNRKRRYDVEEVGEEASTCQEVKRNKFDSGTSQTPLPVNPPLEGRERREGEATEGMEEGITAVKKKVRNRLRRKKRLREKKMLIPNLRKHTDKCAVTHPMRVMTKSQWLGMKSEFKSAQKECLGQLKQVNKQARLNASLMPREEQMECEKKGESEKERGCDKILSQCMQIAKSFKH